MTDCDPSQAAKCQLALDERQQLNTSDARTSWPTPKALPTARHLIHCVGATGKQQFSNLVLAAQSGKPDRGMPQLLAPSRRRHRMPRRLASDMLLKLAQLEKPYAARQNSLRVSSRICLDRGSVRSARLR